MTERHQDLRRSRAARPTTEQLPPHDSKAEEAVVGCLVTDCRKWLPVCVERLGPEGQDSFYDLRNGTVYKTVADMHQQNLTVDLVTLQAELKRRGNLEQVGGVAHLSHCQDASEFLEHNLPAWLDVLSECWTRRRFIAAGANMVEDAYHFSGTEDELAERMERAVMAVRAGFNRLRQHSAKELVKAVIEDIEKLFEAKGRITGLSTGFPDLDQATDGLHGSELVVVAAFPSVGKTSLAMNMAEHLVLEQKVPVGVFSAEMSGKRLMRRMLCSQARVSLREVRMGNLHESDFEKFAMAAPRLANAPIYIDDTAELTTVELRARARRWVQQYGVKLIIGDYAGLFRSPGAENRTNEVSQISKCWKAIAKEHDIACVLLSQLTADKDGDGKLKEARALGEDADGVWYLKRDEEEQDPHEAGEGPLSEKVNVLLKKQRDEDRNVKVRLTFLKPYTRFESAAREEATDE